MAGVGLGRFRGHRRRGVSGAGGAGRTAAVLCCVALAVAGAGGACGGSGGDDEDDDRPGATVPDDDSGSYGDESSSTTMTTAAGSGSATIDITKKPDTITVEYADAVMDELDRILSDAIREFVAADGPTKGFDDKLNAVYDEPSLENKRQVYGKFAVDGADEYKDQPGDVETRVKEILKSEDRCVVMLVERTFAAALVSVDPTARSTSYIAIAPSVPESDPNNVNRSAWSVVFDGNVLEGEDPRSAC